MKPGHRKELTGVFQKSDLDTAFRFIKEPDLILKRIDKPVFKIDML